MNVDLYEYNTWNQKNKKNVYGEGVLIDDKQIIDISYRPVLTPGKDAFWSPGKDPYLSVFKLSTPTDSFEAPTLAPPSIKEPETINVEIKQQKFLEVTNSPESQGRKFIDDKGIEEILIRPHGYAKDALILEARDS